MKISIFVIKIRLQKVNDEFLERKVEFNRELALSQQQVKKHLEKLITFLRMNF